MSAAQRRHKDSTSQGLQNHSRLFEAAKKASGEILALDAEPVCHTVAARFLANNCQVLEGKDDASVLTDSGRHIRDFLESYAVSLAICDLERGNKTIPAECTMFRESSLVQFPVQTTAHLHVTSDEIQACLSTFASSAVVWGTYISHKQNALRFCEAAMSENSRAQSIRLFQRVTQIMGAMVEFFDTTWEKHLSSIVAAVQQAVAEQLNSLTAGLARVQEGLQLSNDYITHKLQVSLEGLGLSVLNVERGLEEMLRNLTVVAIQSQADAEEAYQHALKTFNEEASLAILAVAAEARKSVAEMGRELLNLGTQEVTKSRMAELEEGIYNSSAMVESQSLRIKDNNQQLSKVRKATSKINDDLKEAMSSASDIGSSLSTRFFSSPLWSVGWFSIASLILGSYGLPPSMIRNGGLVAFGK
ncbi:uncharacterized protein B0I36DRAFT_244012 [Microdochium trichocladiopsis]|uniref:Nuclear membrane fusion protein Kar5 n=1 Tax=Microdochium trichocladiopsis TaxID=1682393 RepID=A0A9P9BPR1_9PEZI|nr:uncharacterized protein B0I36DRAFT_244012 [Microdochium trichocladiopsis]KAH7029502.1 hypothetical protein B0I36DRAFT_244012 [Microdochium trichocladiopsis]